MRELWIGLDWIGQKCCIIDGNLYLYGCYVLEHFISMLAGTEFVLREKN